jgi:hypothetical protein
MKGGKSMQLSLRQTEKLLLGNHRFSQLGLSMMLTRLKGIYERNPSQESLEKSMNEINAFLEKFKGILANDFLVISAISNT